MNSHWIQTFSGRQFDLLDPQPEMIELIDIAHALSMTTRFTGHSHYFYSVAEHSVLVSRDVPEELALWGLMHDAAEAYVGDVARPLKVLLPAYQEIEQRVARAIAFKFGLSPLPADLKSLIKHADNALLHQESRKLMGPKPAMWDVDDMKPSRQPIWGFYPMRAKREFLKRWKEVAQ